MPSSTSPVRTSAMIKVPRKVPRMLPTPPDMAVPPMTAAAMASSSSPVPWVGVTVRRKDREMIADSPAASAVIRKRPASPAWS